mmetsp:Transcript_9765/g.24705  ORF Transcript_9765/g.24705 Transcript_9765/m.24705 type:complete len:321 (-) Transcript_9765:1090-2052(-)
MRCCSSSRLSSDVPTLKMHREKSGTSGMRSLGTPRSGRRISAYTMSFVKMSCVMIFAPSGRPSVRMSIGSFFASFSMSATLSDGTHLRASGESGVSCFFLSSSVFSFTFASSSDDSLVISDLTRSFSSASVCFARSMSGSRNSVTLCELSRRYFWMSGRHTSSPASMRALSFCSGSSKRSGVNGSRSYSQLVIERSMRLSPRGKRPVLFSRSANSMVFIDASTLFSSNPSLARRRSSSMTSGSTLSMFSALTPLSPTEKPGCMSSSSMPLAVSASPSFESRSFLRRGADTVPSMRWSRKPSASSVSRSSLSSFSSHCMAT